jgi:hypothetical protein
MATTTNFGWTTPDDTDLVKDGAAAIRTLGSSIDTSLVDLNGGTTGQVLTKASNTDLDFNFTSPLANPLTTTGDIIYSSSGSTLARLGIGTVSQILAVNSGATAPEWVAAPSAGGMTLLSTTSLTGASVTISTISQDYNTLVFDLEDVVPVTDDVNLNIRLNGQTGSVYTELRSMDSSSGASAVATSLKIITAAGNNANDFCNVRLSIPNYTCAFYKYALVTGVYGNQNSDASPPHHSTIGAIGAYLQTTAVSSITFFFASGNFATGSVKLYGVK